MADVTSSRSTWTPQPGLLVFLRVLKKSQLQTFPQRQCLKAGVWVCAFRSVAEEFCKTPRAEGALCFLEPFGLCAWAVERVALLNSPSSVLRFLAA